ncbi:MAG TPA: copper resistance CopC family protein [Allosphingosinicella sp.]|nr:copper resistance CopC family protein [Allosphingosinicella sp.]
MTRLSPPLSLLAAALTACTPQASTHPPDAAPPPASASSLLLRSTPAEGASLSKSPANLVLTFREPVRLHEVTVAGADGSAMPMMLSPAGETASYSLPLPDLDPGSYTVTWRAGASGRDATGTIRFRIR